MNDIYHNLTSFLAIWFRNLQKNTYNVKVINKEADNMSPLLYEKLQAIHFCLMDLKDQELLVKVSNQKELSTKDLESKIASLIGAVGGIKLDNSEVESLLRDLVSLSTNIKKVEVLNPTKVPDKMAVSGKVEITNLPKVQEVKGDFTIKEAKDILLEIKSLASEIRDLKLESIQGYKSIGQVFMGTAGSRESHKITDGTKTATITTSGNSNGLDVNIIGGSSAGTEYTEGDTDTSITGQAVLTESTSDTLKPLQSDSSGNLKVSIEAGGAGNGAILDGADSNIKATVKDLSNSNPVTVAVVDGSGDQITSFGGGTQYTEGDTDASITGTALMFESNTGTNAVSVVSASNPLPISDAGGVITVDGTVAVTNAGITTIAGAVSGTEMQVDVLTMPTTTVQATNLDIRDLTASDIVTIADIKDGAGDSVMDATNNAVKVNIVAGGAGDGAILDGADSGIKATVKDLTNSNPVTVAIVDGSGDQITSFGGGTQYTEGDTDASITGTALMFESNTGTNAVSVVSATNPLPISDAGGTITVDGTVAVTNAGITTIAGAVAGTEMQVDVITMPTVAVTQSGTWDEVGINDSGNSITVDNGGTFAVQVDGNALTSLQLLDDVVATTASTTPTKGYAVSGTDGTNARVLKTDTSGELQIDVLSIAAGNNNIGDVDVASIAAGDNNIGNVDIVTVPSDPFGANADAAATAGSTGTMQAKFRLMTSQLDSIKTAVETLDNTVGGSELQVDVVGALPAGTNAIGKLAANSGVDIGDVDITSVVPGTGATNLGKAEDAGHNSGDVGVAALGVRTDVPNAALAGTTADYSVLSTDMAGGVRTALYETDFAVLGTNHVKKYYTNAGAVTDGIVWSPAAGKRWYVTDLIINTSAAATVTLEDDLTGGDSAVMKFELAANSGIAHRFQTPLFSGEDAADLLVTTSAGNIYITVVGYEI